MDNDEITYLIILSILEFMISPILTYAVVKHEMNSDRIKYIRLFSIGYRLFVWLGIFVVIFLITAILIHVAYHGMFSLI